MTARRSTSVVIIGGGIGGIVPALLLAAKGCRVKLFERHHHVGGKIRSFPIGDRTLDVGPTVLTMRWVFDTIFEDINQQLEDHLTLIPAPCVARHFWEDGSTLDLYTDTERTAAAIDQFAGPKEADGYRRFSAYTATLYENAHRIFIISPSPRISDMARASRIYGLRGFLKIDTMRKMFRAIQSFFGDHRLIQLFARYATYYGSSPFSAPATLNLISFVEQQGVFLPRGGMSDIPSTLARLAEERGAEIRCNTEISKIVVRDNRVTGVQTTGEDFVAADKIIFNGDVAALATGGLLPKRLSPLRSHVVGHFRNRSLSAMTWASVTKTKGCSLAPHNVFFSQTPYRHEFRDIFKYRQLPDNPTVYIRAQDRDSTATRDQLSAERLFGIINAPAVGDSLRFSERQIESCLNTVLGLLYRAGLKTALHPNDLAVTTPDNFHELFPYSGGALYGNATHSMWAPLRRLGARTPIAGLYCAGGTVHPGAGVPMSAISGRQAATAVLMDSDLPPLNPFSEVPPGQECF